MKAPTPPNTPARPSSTLGGRASHTLVWAMTVASVVLLLPVLLFNPADKNAPVSPEAWLASLDPAVFVAAFQDAPPPEIRTGVIRPWPDEETDNGSTSDAQAPHRLWRISSFRLLRWFEPGPRIHIPNHMQYKVDPSFGFADRTLLLDGMMIRVWIDF